MWIDYAASSIVFKHDLVCSLSHTITWDSYSGSSDMKAYVLGNALIDDNLSDIRTQRVVQVTYLWQLSSMDMVRGTSPAFSAKISAEAAAELLQARDIRLPQPTGMGTPSRIASFSVAISAKDAETPLSMCGYRVPEEYFGMPGAIHP